MFENMRALHYDIARGAYLKPERFMEAIRLAAASGFTHFLPYLENMLLLERVAKQSPGCAYSLDQMRDFALCAKEAGIGLIPHFNVVGHTVELCSAYPELGDGELDITRPIVIDTMSACLEELLPLCYGGPLLIGGDEWQAPRELVQREGAHLGRIFADYLNRIMAPLVAKGVKPILWHDMLLHYPEALESLSRDFVIAFWIYDEDSGHPLVEMLQDMGFEVIIAAGICNWLSRRRAKGVKQALDTARRRKTGMMVTNWEDCRWEIAREVIPLIGGMLEGKAVPEAELDVMSRIEAMERLRPDGECHAIAAARLSERLGQLPSTFTGVANEIRRRFDGDNQTRLALFLENHYPEGCRFELLKSTEPIPPLPQPAEPVPRRGPDFGLNIDKDNVLGGVVCIHNGAESFKLYPKFGMSLQDWWSGGNQLIENPAVLAKSRPGVYPGGYRSHSFVGGLRPIVGFGAWHNPCIFWSYPFEWNIEEETAEHVLVSGSLRLHHASLRCRVAVERGRPGFTYQLHCVNALDWKAVFRLGFNFPIATTPQDLRDGILEHKSGGFPARTRFTDVTDSLLRLPGDMVTVWRKDYAVTARTTHGRNAGIWVDWTDQMLTPDFRGEYTWLKPGGELDAEWRFEATC